jgi:hypothetical protein
MFHLNIGVSIGFGARKSFEMAANKFTENEKVKRNADELQLMREKAANELFFRLYPQIERLASLRVEKYAHDPRVGNILSVATKPPTEVQVSRKEQVEALLFSFDSLNREVRIVFEGSVHYHRILRVEIGTGTKPILTDQRLPDEPFMPISWNNLPAMVNDSIDALLGIL